MDQPSRASNTCSGPNLAGTWKVHPEESRFPVQGHDQGRRRVQRADAGGQAHADVVQGHVAHMRGARSPRGSGR